MIKINGHNIGVVLRIEEDDTTTIMLFDNHKEYALYLDNATSRDLDMGVFPWCPRIEDADLELMKENLGFDNLKDAMAEKIWFIDYDSYKDQLKF